MKYNPNTDAMLSPTAAELIAGNSEFAGAGIVTFYDVSEFNIASDGTDSTAAMQAVIDDLPNTGLASQKEAGVLYFPRGTYKFSITIPDNTAISFMGDKPSTLIVPANDTSPAITVVGDTYSKSRLNGLLLFQNLEFQGPAPNATTGTAISIEDNPAVIVNIKVENCSFSDLRYGFVTDSQTYGLKVINNHFEDVDQAISLQDTSNNANLFLGNYYKNIDSCAIYIRSGSGNVISDEWFENVFGVAVYIGGSSKTTNFNKLRVRWWEDCGVPTGDSTKTRVLPIGTVQGRAIYLDNALLHVQDTIPGSIYLDNGSVLKAQNWDWLTGMPYEVDILDGSMLEVGDFRCDYGGGVPASDLPNIDASSNVYVGGHYSDTNTAANRYVFIQRRDSYINSSEKDNLLTDASDQITWSGTATTTRSDLLDGLPVWEAVFDDDTERARIDNLTGTVDTWAVISWQARTSSGGEVSYQFLSDSATGGTGGYWASYDGLIATSDKWRTYGCVIDQSFGWTDKVRWQLTSGEAGHNIEFAKLQLVEFNTEEEAASWLRDRKYASGERYPSNSIKVNPDTDVLLAPTASDLVAANSEFHSGEITDLTATDLTTGEYFVVGQSVTTGLVLPTEVQIFDVTAGAATPSDTDSLTPTTWISIELGGVTYKIPGYL